MNKNRHWRLAPFILASLAVAAPSGAATRGPSVRQDAAQLHQARSDRQTHYTIVDLGARGANSSVANSINNLGWVSGVANLRGSHKTHAALWTGKRTIDLGTLGGPNSGIQFPVKNNRGELTGESDLAQIDPFAEMFCGDAHLCQGFRWRNGVMTPLPTLGGNNGVADGVNNRGQVVGLAENSIQDPSCVAPQVFDFYGIIYQPNGKLFTLPPYPGDTISAAIAINDSGQVVGASGPCGPVAPQTAVHALLWQTGSTVDLGNLGGTISNLPQAINNRGQVIGFSGLPGNTTSHAFLWQNGVMSDLGTLPGDVWSAANGMNDKGQIVGQSCDASGNCRAFVWQNGSMIDLNLLVPPNSRLYLACAYDINDSGQIAGQAYDAKTGRTSAYLLMPTRNSDAQTEGHSTRKVILPGGVREQFRNRRGFAGFGLLDRLDI